MRGNIRNYALQQLPRDRIPVVIYNKPDHAESQYLYVEVDRSSPFLSVIRMINKIYPIFQKGYIGWNIMQRFPFIPAIKHGQKRGIDSLSISAEAGNINPCIIVPVFKVSFLHLIEAAIFKVCRYDLLLHNTTWKISDGTPPAVRSRGQEPAAAVQTILLVLYAGISHKYKILIGKPFLMGMVTAMGQIWPLCEDLNQILIR